MGLASSSRLKERTLQWVFIFVGAAIGEATRQTRLLLISLGSSHGLISKLESRDIESQRIKLIRIEHTRAIDQWRGDCSALRRVVTAEDVATPLLNTEPDS